ncbi:DNA N-6-adenine-methyltransferase [Pseudoalteromonas rhizosphaerae]|uniref:DNA N-6-adenine-methyltransferase n=1 Tax=Pseudoalteromonas rhizosphaerae TaxID=2518973 RepID=UPI00384D11F4
MASHSNHQSKSRKSTRDTTQTPQWLFAALNSQYHYVLDAAATNKSALCERFYTPRNNALKKDWSADISLFLDAPNSTPAAWLNPPYSKILPWVDKVIEQQHKGVLTTLLVPRDNRTEWWPASSASKIIDIVGYYEQLGTYKSGPKKGQQKQKWRSGGIRFIDSKTCKELPAELNKPMCIIEFNPHQIGQPCQYATIAKNVLMALGQQALNQQTN